MTDSALVKEAIAWGKAGIPVFPCKADKRPLTEHGFKDAVTEPEQIRKLFEFFGDAATMIGGRMGDGLFAVDIDLYKGKEVEAWYQARVDDGSLVETRTHTTQSGGVHLFYEADDSPSCNPVAGVEVKGDGGYVILPGTPGYTVVKEGLVKAPDGLLEILRYSASTRRGSAMAELEGQVLSGADFHNSLTQIAAKLAFRGKTQIEIQKHLLDLMDNSTAKNPGHDRHARWLKVMTDSGGELSRISGSAYVKFNEDATIEAMGEFQGLDQLAGVAEGIFTQVGNFEPGKPTEIQEYKEDEWPFTNEGYFADQEHDLRNVNFTMYPIYTENETVVLFAEPKTGKTAVALTTALHIACGFDLGSLRVAAAGSCLYYALEGSHAIRLRVASWKKVMRERDIELPDRIPLFVVEKPHNFIKEETRISAANQIIAAHKYAAKTENPLKVIFIDTLTKAMSGGDQNSVEDTSNLFDLVGLCRQGGVTATIVFVHHKSRQGNVRGSSNIEAEPDMLLDVSKKGEVVKLRVARARSIEDGNSFHFAITDVDLGKTSQGHPLHGMFVDPLEVTDADAGDDPNEVILLSKRRKVITELGKANPTVTLEEVMAAWYEQKLIDPVRKRGQNVCPHHSAPSSKLILANIADDAGGTVFGDFVIRPHMDGAGELIAFKVGEAAF